jgi:hypothetical protein
MSAIYIPKDCMNQIIDQLKLLNTKKFIILASVSSFYKNPHTDLNGVKCFITEANNKEEALENFIETKTGMWLVLNILKNHLNGFMKELNISYWNEEIVQKYKKLFIPRIMEYSIYIKIIEIQEIEVDVIF